MNAISTLDPVRSRIADGDEPLFEIIDGQRVEIPHMGFFATMLANRLLFALISQSKGEGQAVMECLFHLSLPVDRNRRPDVAFVSYQRWPKDSTPDKDANAWDVVPELAVEVVSPNDDAEELLTKIDEYFRAGVRLVWVVYPKQAVVHIYESFTAVRILSRDDTLDGGAVLSGFRLPLRDLFVEA